MRIGLGKGGPGGVKNWPGTSHIGQTAHIEELKIIKSSKPNLAQMKGKNVFSTLQSYVFLIGNTKPVITLPEVKIK